jgi:ArsR family transcriptional regulator
MKTKPATRADALFRAFADPTRLRILNLLKSGELCVCDLVEVLDVPQPKASRHLAYLRRVGLVSARKEGYWSYYRIAAKLGPLHAKLLESLGCCGAEMPEFARDLKLVKTRCGKGCCD